MRVITGAARGRKLNTPQGGDIRPSSGMVKSAVFNMIQNDVSGSNILDLFAGTGQMGIEALSRGARCAVFVDNRKEAGGIIRLNLESTGLSDRARLVTADSISYIKICADTFDIAFLDPPYGLGMIGAVLPEVAKRMSERGIIVCEYGKGGDTPEEVCGFVCVRRRRYGRAMIAVYRNPKYI